MILAGVDYSLCCPSICLFNGGQFDTKNCSFHFLSDTIKYQQKFSNNITGYFYDISSFKHEQARYSFIAEWSWSILKDAELVCIEGYAFGAKGKVFHIAENTELLKYNLWLSDIKYITAPPTTIKKEATGKGNSKKDEMYKYFNKETNIDLITTLSYTSKNIGSPIGDIADSYFLCKHAFKEKNKNGKT